MYCRYVSIFKVPWCIYPWGCLFFLFHISAENFNSGLKNSELELWESFPFTKEKWYHNLLRFGSKSSKLSIHRKDNSNKNLRSIFNIHVYNELGMWFWCFGRRNSFIFNKMNLECYGEWFIVLFCCRKFSMYVRWEDKEIYIVVFWCEIFLCRPALVCWQGLA